jgi:hypothetical protein
MNKETYDFNKLVKYCSESNIELVKNYENVNVTRDTKIYGNCNTNNCCETFAKSLRYMIKYGAYCKKCTYIKQQINIKKTNLNKYGVENPFQCEEIKEKIKVTNLEKYGVENPTYSKEIREQTKKKCLEKYGVEHTCKLSHVIEKLKESNLNKYNSEYPFQSSKYQEIFKAKCIEKYGMENPSQNSEIADKKSKNSYKRKTYVLPSGKELICQGYEPFALDKLINKENIDENDIVTGCKNVPTIWYNDDSGKKHRHFVDVFIKSQNRCIEVKSTWTAEKKKDSIFLKQNAGKQLGYSYEIWIFNKKKEIVECHK